MKKLFILFALVSYAQSTVCMDKKSGGTGALGRAAQTVYDKWDPTGILEELHKKGVSQDKREMMTQMHRLDRIIPLHIESRATEELCDNLTTIVTKGYPLSTIPREMAHDYLWKLRSSLLTNKPLLDRVTATLDLLNPAQIIVDLREGQTYSEKQIDLENRLNQAMEQLVELRKTSELQQLVAIIANRRARESAAIIPGERVRQLAYGYLRSQEKENKTKKTLLVETFGAKKSDSDTED